ncbi:uncharacterized protein LOC143300312 [Babylonia areolata]|uniref:uncharacterized protein LOC143300312 n=1 Tax=Babylonia areolata TaxID=304850 RepID=UPI003FD47CEB
MELAQHCQLQTGSQAPSSEGTQAWDTRICLGEWFLEVTSEWLTTPLLTQGVPIAPPTLQVALFTDASSMGWGAHMDSLHAAGTWSPEERLCHINVLELEAVRRALQHFMAEANGKTIRLFTDNTTVACYVNKGGGAHSADLSLRTEALLRWCHSKGIALSARHIAGKDNILADALSRSKSVIHTEWTLDKDTLQGVWEQWFRPMVDLFATRFSKRLPTYVSPVADPEAWAVDALSLDWSSLIAYAFPPFPILSKVHWNWKPNLIC